MIPEPEDTLQLERISIKRHGRGWIVSRGRKDNGESAYLRTLEDCFNYIRSIYDENGNYEKTMDRQRN